MGAALLLRHAVPLCNPHPHLPATGPGAPAVRKLSAFDEAVVLCDVGAKGWPIRFVNSRWCKATGG